MNLLEQIKRDERLKLSAYRDSESFWTIGYGRMIDERKGGGISRDEAEYLLANDIGRVQRELDQHLGWWRSLSEERQAVMVGMAFQMGIAGLCAFVYTLAHIQAGHYADAAVEMLNSKWARQTPARAKRLSKQMETSHWQ